MGECIGLDFGTTYSTIAYLTKVKKENNRVSYERIEINNAVNQYDSLVVKNHDGDYYYGEGARSYVGDSGAIAYQGFKVLLSDEKATLQHPEYDQNTSPKDITELFITKILSLYLRDAEEEYIDRLVVGVPEIWFDEKWKDRGSLHEIISSIKKKGTETPLVKEVQLISEPACACAYFIDNYKKNTGKNFTGKMLLIDYGGGTLDITWCNVETTKDGNSEISVPPKGRFGAGANSERFLGKAGLLFLESVVSAAIMESGLPEEQIIKNSSFRKCVQELETTLIKNEEIIRDNLAQRSPDIKDKEVKTITYKLNEDERGRNCKITYGVLQNVFNETIKAPVLVPMLNEAIDFFDRDKSEDSKLSCYSEKDDLKIAMIGGFCNFVLTEETIKNHRQLHQTGQGDKRYRDIDSNRAVTGITRSMSRKNAVAYGAALLANGVIRYKVLAPYSLTAVVGYGTGEKKEFPLMKEGEEIEYDTPIIWTDTISGELSSEGNYLLKENANLVMKSPGKLALPSAGKGHAYQMAISLNKSAIISCHIRDFGTAETYDGKAKSERIIPLADIHELMGVSDVSFSKKK